MILPEWIMGMAMLVAAGTLLAGCKESDDGEGDGDVEEEEGDADAADHDADAPDRPDDTVSPDDVPVDDVAPDDVVPDDGVTPEEVVEEDAGPPDVPEEDAVEDPVDVVPDPEPEPDIVPDPEPEPDIVPDPEPEPDVRPDFEPDPDVVPDPEPDPDIVPDPEPEPDIAPDLEPDPDLADVEVVDIPDAVPSNENWDLEDWTTTNPPPGFEKATAAELASYSMTQSAQNHTPGGAYSAELTWTTQNNVDIHPQYRYPVTAGMQYSCHGWFLDNDPAGRLRFFIGWYNAADVLTRDFSLTYTTDSAAWQELVYQSTAPAGAVAMICGIRLYDIAATWDGNATILFDDLSISAP